MNLEQCLVLLAWVMFISITAIVYKKTDQLLGAFLLALFATGCFYAFLLVLFMSLSVFGVC